MCSLRHGQHVQHQCALADLMHEVPDIVNLLSPKARAAVLGCNRQLRQLVHNRARTITVNSTKHVAALVKRNWLQLSLVVVTRCACDYKWPENSALQLLAELHINGQCSTYQASQHWGAQFRLRQCFDAGVFVVCPMSRMKQAECAREQHIVQALVHLQGSQYSQVNHVSIQRDSCGAAVTRSLSTFYWPKLGGIIVRNVQLGDAAMVELVKGNWPNLWQLSLREHGLDATALSHLSRASWLQLEVLLVA